MHTEYLHVKTTTIHTTMVLWNMNIYCEQTCMRAFRCHTRDTKRCRRCRPCSRRLRRCAQCVSVGVHCDTTQQESDAQWHCEFMLKTILSPAESSRAEEMRCAVRVVLCCAVLCCVYLRVGPLLQLAQRARNFLRANRKLQACVHSIYSYPQLYSESVHVIRARTRR